MIEGSSHILPETAQAIAMAEVARRSASIKETGNMEINMPTFRQLLKNTLISLLGKNVPKP